MNKICYGCGLKLQSEFPDELGFIPPNKIASSYCQRCYKLIHYGEQKSNNTPKETQNIIKAINNDNKFVIFLIDFLTINSEIIKLFNSIKKNKLLLISKYDLLPKNIKDYTITNYLKNNYQIKSDIKFVSSKKNYKLDKLLNYLYKNNIKWTYIVGLSNSGKSTLINKLIDINNVKINKMTTSKIPNTTMDFIRVKLNDNLTIIDSPGFEINDYDKGVIISSPLKPLTYQMKENEILKIEDIYLRFSQNTSVTLYINRLLNVEKYYQDIVFNHEFIIQDNSDLIIKGLGFINIKNKGKIKAFNLFDYEIRKSIFGDKHE